MTHATQALRDAGYTAARLYLERTELVPRLAMGVQAEWAEMFASVMRDETPRFCLEGTRYALRRYGVMRASPMVRLAVCDECGESADYCRCASEYSGRLYVYTCPECGSAREDGEPCCASPDDDADDDYTPPSDTGDGYARGAWSRIERREVDYQGRRYAWAPYYVGIELETDSTPTPDDWRDIYCSPHVMGAWPDGTVRGPEIVSQPVKGYALAHAVVLLSSLQVSLTSSCDPIGQQCGMHIHVDAREATRETRLAFVRLWMVAQDALWSRPDMHLRKGGGYCTRLSRAEAEQVERVIAGTDTYGTGYPSRYRDCNFSALAEHSTIEVRLFGWPATANRWNAAERASFMWRCIRTVQGLRLAARLVGESGLGLDHPIYQCDSETAIALIESIIPACPANEGSK